MKINKKLYFICLCSLSQIVLTAQYDGPLILSEKERAEVVDDILEDRIDNLLPQLMERSGIDMWVLISREYNEDPVMKTMLPSKWLSARRRTIFVFYRAPDGHMDRIAIARYSVGKLLKGAWDIDVYPDQWDALAKIIEGKSARIYRA